MSEQQQVTRIDIEEDFLTCTICLDRYNNAKILPCLHSYCQPCIIQLINKDSSKIRCPLCRQECPIPGGGVEQLKPSFFLNSILDMVVNEQRKKDANKACDGCQEGALTSRCVDCALDICNVCAGAHRKIPATKNHRLLPYEEYLVAKSRDPAMVQPAVYCTTHPGSEVKFYCQTCMIPICVECTVVSHRIPDHKHKELKKAAAKFRGLLEERLDDLLVTEGKIHEAGKMAKQISETATTRYSEQQHAIKKRTEEAIERLTRRLKEEEKELLEELRIRHDEVKENVQNEIDRFQSGVEVTTKTRVFVENLMKYGNASQLMNIGVETTMCLDQLNAFEVKSPDDIDAFPHFVPKEVGQKGKLGSISVSLTASQLLINTKDLQRTVKVGKQLYVTIETIDYVQKKLLSCPDLVAELTEPNGRKARLETIEREGRTRNDKSYMVRLVNNMVGTHTLSVTVHDRHVKDSPYSFEVLPPMAWKSRSESESSDDGKSDKSSGWWGRLPGWSGLSTVFTGNEEKPGE
ncbi:E3 ubiquitin-protein ligase TRIM56-like [Glandiceps talaboti]